METIETIGYATVIVIVVFLTVASTGLLIPNQQTSLDTTIQASNLKVYTDQELTKNCTQINFGILKPGNITSQTVYLKNTGKKPISLSMIVDSWNPVDAKSYLAISWNRKDHIIKGNETISATLTLDVNEDVEGFSDFSFRIVMVGAQVENL